MGCAGILPIANHDGKLYCLFGKEGPYDENQGYADFGGGTKPGETPFQNAVREGCEELSGFFGNEKEVAKWIRTEKIRTIKLVETRDRIYTTFIVRTEYDENLPFYFRNNFEFMKKHLNPIVKNCDNGFYEKSQMKWFPIDELIKDIGVFRDFYKDIVRKIVEDKEAIIRAFFKKGTCNDVVRIKPSKVIKFKTRKNRQTRRIIRVSKS